MRLAPAAIVVAVVFAGCGSADVPAEPVGSSAPPSPTVAAVAPQTTPVTAAASSTTMPRPATSTTALVTTTTALDSVPLPSLLVVTPDAVVVWEGADQRQLWAGSALAAFPDGSGGAVIDVDDDRRFEWDDGIGRYRVTPSDQADVVLVGADGTVVPMLEDAGDGIHRLLDVAEVLGRPTAVLWRAVPGSPCCGDPEAASAASGSILNYLVLHDLETGVEASYGLVATYESDAVIAAFGGDAVVMATSIYGAGTSGLRWTPLDALVRDEPWPAEPGEWLDEPCEDGGCAPVPPSGPCDPYDDCLPLAGTPSVAPDGSGVAFVESLELPESSVAREHGVQVVVADLPSGTERWRVRLEGINRFDNLWPMAVDFDGMRVLVSFSGAGGSPDGVAVLVDATGEVARVDIPGPAVHW